MPDYTYPRDSVRLLTSFIRESVYGLEADLEIRTVRDWCRACVKNRISTKKCKVNETDLLDLAALRTALIDAHNVGQTTFVPDEWANALPAISEAAQEIQSYLNQEKFSES